MTTPSIPAWEWTELQTLSGKGELDNISPTVLGSIDQAESSGQGGGINSSGYGGWFGLGENTTYPGQSAPTTPGLLQSTTVQSFDAQAEIAADEFGSLLTKTGGNPITAEQDYQGGGTEGSSILAANLGNASPYSGANAVQTDAMTTGLDANPLNGFGIPGTIGGALGGAAGAAGSAAVTGATAVLGTLISPLKQYIEDAGLIILGIVIIVVGLVVVAHAGLDAANGKTAQAKAARRQSSPAPRRSSSSPAPAKTSSSGGEGKAAAGDAAKGIKSGEEVAAVAAA